MTIKGIGPVSDLRKENLRMRDSVREIIGGSEIEDNYLIEVLKSMDGVFWKSWGKGNVAYLEDIERKIRDKAVGNSLMNPLGEFFILRESFLEARAFGFGEYAE